MTPEEFQPLRKILVGLVRDVSKLRAFETAFDRLMLELLKAGAVNPAAIPVLEKFHEWKDEEFEQSLLELEKTLPGLAAELSAFDNERDSESQKGYQAGEE